MHELKKIALAIALTLGLSGLAVAQSKPVLTVYSYGSFVGKYGPGKTVKERFEATEMYEGKRQPLRHILQCQARHVATFVRGDRADYLPFILGW